MANGSIYGFVGKKATEKALIDVNRRVRVNPEYAPSDIRVKPMDAGKKKFRCVMCGTEFTSQKGNFPTGGKSPLWKGNGGFLPFCKVCCDTIFRDLTYFYSGNEEHALKRMCAIFDWYYSPTASAMTAVQVRENGSRATLYPAKMATSQVAMCGSTYLDTIREEAIPEDVITEVKDVIKPVSTPGDEADSADSPVTSPATADGFVVTPEMVRRWGGGFTPEEYRFLEEEYADWVARNVCNTKSQEEIYRNIALAQLDIRLARQGKNGMKITDAQDALQKLMNSANILPRQTAENILADTQSFGTLIEKYERTKPIPEPAPEWRDVDCIRKYTNTWYRGGLSKALHVKTENARLYEEAVKEMDKYSVKKSQGKQSVDGMGAAIFDDVDGKGGDEK